MRALLLLIAMSLSACATTENPDPLEKFNRAMFTVNRVGDKIIYKPFGKGYEAVVPRFARKGVYNFFDNLKTPRSSVNNFLQGKPGRGFSELARFIFNSTLGVGGLFDIGAAGDLDRYDEDFAQTLAVWGLPEGAYVMLPIFGARSMLSTVALPIDFRSDLQNHFGNTGTRDKLYVLRLLDTRARQLSNEEEMMRSYDPYIFLRSAFLKNREWITHDCDVSIDDDDYCIELLLRR